MPELVRLRAGQVTILPGTRDMVWARWGPVDIKLYSNSWHVDAPDAPDGQALALVVHTDHIGWQALVARNGRGLPPHPSGTYYGQASE